MLMILNPLCGSSILLYSTIIALWSSGVLAQRKILDISQSVNPDDVMVSEDSDGPVTYTLFFPRIHILISTVRDGEEVIWESPSRFENCTSFRLVRENGRTVLGLLKSDIGFESNKCHFKYVESDPEAGAEDVHAGSPKSWIPIPEDEYGELLGRMINRKFDIAGPVDYRYINVQRYQELGVPSFIYTPYDYYMIKRVTDGDTTIWKGGDYERCTLILVQSGECSEGGAAVSSRDDIATTRKLLRLYVQCANTKHSLYFENKVDGWESITRDVFYDKMEQHSGEATLL